MHCGSPLRALAPELLPLRVLLQKSGEALGLLSAHRRSLALLQNGLPMISRPEKVGADLQKAQSNFNHCGIAGLNPVAKGRMRSIGVTKLRIARMKLITSSRPFLSRLIALAAVLIRLMMATLEPVYLR